MFIQVIKGHIDDPSALRAGMQRWIRDLAPQATGWLGSTTGVTGDGTAVALARFESDEAARRNSERPEQHEWWMETAKLFTGDITFQDSREVRTMGAGASADAGFVQVIQGRYTDVTAAIEMMTSLLEPLQRLRPDVLGGELCLHDGGRFTQAMYFTSEADAREGERREPPPDVAPQLDRYGSLMQDVRFYDLADPWTQRPQ
jgi:hypothetical protein